MPPHMVCLIPFLGSDGRVRHLPISVPLVPCLIDNTRYYLPGDLPETPGFHSARPSAARLARALRENHMESKATPRHEPERRRTRAPTLRSLVKLALACQSAEEMGKRLKRRFERQQQRRARLAREAAGAERVLAQD
jgi:hypothetical protein